MSSESISFSSIECIKEFSSQVRTRVHFFRLTLLLVLTPLRRIPNGSLVTLLISPRRTTSRRLVTGPVAEVSLLSEALTALRVTLVGSRTSSSTSTGTRSLVSGLGNPGEDHSPTLTDSSVQYIQISWCNLREQI